MSTEEAYHQCSGGYAVQTCLIISTDVLHLQYGRECEVQTCHVISTGEAVQYRNTKTAQGVADDYIYLEKNDIYRQYY